MPVRIQRKRIKGYRMPPNTVSVTRPGRWGNPFPVGMFRDFGRADAVRWYVHWLKRDFAYRSSESIHGKPPTTKEIRRELRGKNLACYCPIGEPCHAEVLLKIANAPRRRRA